MPPVVAQTPTLLLLTLGALAAGVLGSMTGLGGGAVLVPLLVMGLGLDLPHAVAASLVAVLAGSLAAGSAYLRRGLVDVRTALWLESATVPGAVLGAYLATLLPVRVVALVFTAVLFYSAVTTLRPPRAPDAGNVLPAPGPGRYAASWAVMFLAGVLSALVGIGSGVVKVLAMDRLLRLPFRVSTATSTFMIALTTATAAGVYAKRGLIEPTLAAPLVGGILAGSSLGAFLLPKVRVRVLRVMFASLVMLMGAGMLWRAARGEL